MYASIIQVAAIIMVRATEHLPVKVGAGVGGGEGGEGGAAVT